MVATVLDANCWCARVDEVLSDTSGIAIKAFEKAQALGKIVFDNDGHIRQQYIDARKGFGEQLFNAFFEQAVLRGTVQIVANVGNQQLRKQLIASGLPRKELHYFQAADTAKAAFIVSEDIDFFDPKLKRANESAKRRAKSARTGCICKLSRTMIGAEIYCLNGYLGA
jgi:hypothetical protein